MDTRERARQRAAARQASSWFKLVPGDNGFRILPTPASKTTPDKFFEYRVHREVGPRKLMLRCGKDIEDKGSCWLCDSYIPKLKKGGHDGRASAISAKDQLVLQVAKVDDGKMTGPFLFSPSAKVGDQILSSILGSKKKIYDDPKKGYNLNIHRTGTGKNDTRYGIIEPDEDPSPVPQSVLSQLKPFSDLQEISPYSMAKQKAAIQGVDAIEEEEEDEDEDVDTDTDEEEEEDEEDEEPEPVKTSGKKKAPPVEEEDEEEEDEAQPPPVKKSKKAKPAPVEEEDEEEEEDEDEPPPSKKAGKKKASPVAEEDEDEEDIDIDDEDLDIDEEDEEPEPVAVSPKKKAGKKKAPPVPDDDDEEDEEDEEPLPPAPKKKKSKQ